MTINLRINLISLLLPLLWIIQKQKNYTTAPLNSWGMNYNGAMANNYCPAGLLKYQGPTFLTPLKRTTGYLPYLNQKIKNALPNR